jgi:Arc/MetJ family transcription regulator
MGVNVHVDERLVEEAERVTGEHDREKLVARALRELVCRSSPLQGMLDLAGSDILRDDYDYKALREGRGK